MHFSSFLVGLWFYGMLESLRRMQRKSKQSMWWMHGGVRSLHLYFVGSSRAPLCSCVFYGQKVHEDYASITLACYGKILHLTPRRYCGFLRTSLPASLPIISSRNSFLYRGSHFFGNFVPNFPPVLLVKSSSHGCEDGFSSKSSSFVKLREIAHDTSCPKFREMKT